MHRDERDQREADHQRRGGRGGARRVAHRVLAGEPAGDAAEAGAGSADARTPAGGRRASRPSRRRRTGRARRAIEREQPRLDVDAVGEQAVREQPDRASATTPTGRDRLVAGEPRLRQHRALAHGRDRLRRASRGAPGRRLASERDQRADGEADDDRPRSEDRATVRQLDARRLEQRVSPTAMPSPRNSPITEPRGRRPATRARRSAST